MLAFGLQPTASEPAAAYGIARSPSSPMDRVATAGRSRLQFGLRPAGVPHLDTRAHPGMVPGPTVHPRGPLSLSDSRVLLEHNTAAHNF